MKTFTVWLVGIILLPCITDCTGRELVSDNISRIALERPVHFQSSSGTDVVASAGNYQVQPAGEMQLRLIPQEGSPITVRAQSSTHQVYLVTPLALAIPWGEDEQHILLAMPDGQSLVAVGSLSGVRGRGTATLSQPPLVLGQPGFAPQLQSLTNPIVYPVKTGCSPTSGEGGTGLRPPTAYLWTPAGAFTPDNTADYQHMVRTDTSIFDPSYSLHVRAPISLPHGATIREIAVFLSDNSPDTNLIVYLKQYPDPLVSTSAIVPITHMYAYSSCVQGNNQVMVTSHGLRINSANGPLFIQALIYKQTSLKGVRIGYFME
jgi:hypothetical protein